MFQSTSLSVLTFNTWGLKVGPWHISPGITERTSRMIDAIRELNADFVALQEVWCDDVAKELQDKLGYPFSSYSPNRQGIRGRVGNGLLFLSKYPILQEKLTSFSTYTRWFEFFSNKGIRIHQIETPSGKINILNTHLGSGYTSDDQQRRLTQTHELKAALEMAGRHYPIILAGDFNFDPDSAEYYDLASWIKHRFEGAEPDTFRHMAPHNSGYTYFPSRSFADTSGACDERIDYIFSLVSNSNRSALELTGSQVVLNDPSQPLSDHAGLLSSFRLMRNATLLEAIDLTNPKANPEILAPVGMLM